jgi:hypothetical protein
MNANIRLVGGAIVTAGAAAGAALPEAGYTHGFVFLLICSACAVAAALLIPSRRPVAQEPPPGDDVIIVRNGRRPGARSSIVEVE